VSHLPAPFGLVGAMSTNTNQPRQPKGVPVGGQWRATARPEGSVALAEAGDEWEDWDRREAAVAVRIACYHPDCAGGGRQTRFGTPAKHANGPCR